MRTIRLRWTAAIAVIACVLLAVGCGSAPGSTGSASGGQGQQEAGGTPANPADSGGSGAASGTSSLTNVSLGKVSAVRLIDAKSGWTGGDGWIARTDDKGKSWRAQYKGSATIDQIFALNGKQAWAILGQQPDQTNERQLLQTNDGGSKWTIVGKVPDGDFIHFTSEKEAFIGNQHSTDGGRTWSALTIPDGTIGNTYFYNDKIGWAMIKAQEGTFQAMRTTDGGNSWQLSNMWLSKAPLNGAVIRSAGPDDAWVQCIGDSGMSQTSFALYHTQDGGKKWRTVIAKSTAGAGPAPGWDANVPPELPQGWSKPGPLYVVDSATAFMGGYCPACDNANSIGWTNDGGATWNVSKSSYPGSSGALLAIADAKNGWWITTSVSEPSVMYTTSDGGATWQKAHEFDKPQPAPGT